MSVATMDPAPTTTRESDYVINVRGLSKHFEVKEGVLQRVTGHVRAVNGVNLDIRRGETVGLVGESGCGKTTLGRCIGGLMPVTGGGVYFGLDDPTLQRLDTLLELDDAATPEERKELQVINRRHRIDAMDRSARFEYRRNCQMVFQDSFSSLSPRHLVKDIVGRPLTVHDVASGPELTERVVDLLESVGLGSEHLYRYPHQFSGGQRQRISIARALALDPAFIILDEPTSALDVSVQAQILNLLHRLQEKHGLTYLFVSHDLNVVRHMSDRIVLMYVGEVLETGEAEDMFGSPLHPYTEALLAANPGAERDPSGRRIILHGTVPDPANPPAGCRFHTRCHKVTKHCGWEVDDARRRLDDAELLADLVRIDRVSDFEATFVFSHEAGAELAAEGLRSSAIPSVMRGAITSLRVEGERLHVAFGPVGTVRLEEPRPGHLTSCLLYTEQGRAIRRNASVGWRYMTPA